MRNITIVHDFDEPLFTRKTCLRRAFWLIIYALFGWSRRIRGKLPVWLMYEKYSQAKALATLDKLLGIESTFAFTSQVDRAFPTLRHELEALGSKVVNHWHLNDRRKGYNEWKSRGAWPDEDLANPSKHYMNYDRHYVKGEKVMPDDGTIVCWHVDHMSFNLCYYLEFLDMIRCS